MKSLFFLFVALIVFSHPVTGASAERGVHSNSSGREEAQCSMVETAQVTVTLNHNDTDIAKLKAMMDGDSEEIKKYAPEAGIENIELQSLSYNISNNGGGDCSNNKGCVYNLNGSVSYNVVPAGKAVNLTALLTGKGYNTDMYVNAYRECSESSHGD